MKRSLVGILVALGLTCAFAPLQAQSNGGAFLPAFGYDISGAWTFSGTIPTLTGNGSVVGTTATQTLTNKTLTTPVLTRPSVVNLVPTTVALTVADSLKVSVQTLATGTQTYTLPTAASAPGAVYTFICQHASSEILVTPNAADQISIKGLVDHSTSVKPAAGTGVKNTAATNVIGDHLTLVSDGVLTWYEIAGAGIWASQ